ncbi:hypothetical protein FRC00_001780 [Tulasnella sp. 408]|nr:hypothetical protein FRC00_001780 [Tulasnella sp. 408]
MSDQFRDLKCNLDGEIVLDSLILVNTTGAFCDLFTATHPTRIEIEASVWKMLRHPRILEFLGIGKIGEKIYLVSPFAENGSLPGFLKVRPDVEQHSGIGSIITSVLLSAERPPKEPLTAPDGTQYLQLWDEASRCWDEDPVARPSIASVLTRLDHERAEVWITAQQIALETSLDPSVEIQLISGPDKNDQPAMVHVTDTMQTLRWAESIRSRLTTFMNSKLPISRLTRQLLAAIILRDDTVPRLPADILHFTMSSEAEYLESRISCMFRSAQLRRVSRAWRRAVDTSTQLCEFVWVNDNQGNVKYILQRNSDGPLGCLVSGWMPGPLLATLRPLTPRISYMAMTPPSYCVAELLRTLEFPKLTQVHVRWKAEELLQRRIISLNPGANSAMTLVLDEIPFQAFEPTTFGFLRTIKILGGMSLYPLVYDTFIADLFAMLNASPNLAELVLEDLSSERELDTSPPPRATHRGLRRMRLWGIVSPVLSALLLYLDAENLSTVVINGIEPSHLSSVDSAFARTLLSLARSSHSTKTTGELWLGSGVRPDENALVLKWPARTSAVHDKPPSVCTWHTWDFNRIITADVSNVNATKLFHALLDLAIKVDVISFNTNYSGGNNREVLDRSLGLLSPDSQSWIEILTRLESVERMVIGVGVLDGALKHLSEPILTTGGGPQYACPNLTSLAVPDQLRSPHRRWEENPNMFREHIGRRQQAAGSPNGPARLKKMDVPATWIDHIQGADPVFNDVEIGPSSLFY